MAEFFDSFEYDDLAAMQAAGWAPTITAPGEFGPSAAKCLSRREGNAKSVRAHNPAGYKPARAVRPLAGTSGDKRYLSFWFYVPSQDVPQQDAEIHLAAISHPDSDGGGPDAARTVEVMLSHGPSSPVKNGLRPAVALIAGSQVSDHSSRVVVTFDVWHHMFVRLNNADNAGAYVNMWIDGIPIKFDSASYDSKTRDFTGANINRATVGIGYVYPTDITEPIEIYYDDLWFADTLPEGAVEPCYTHIVSVQATKQEDGVVKVGVATSVPCDVSVDCGLTTEYGASVNADPITGARYHEALIGGLVEGETYHYQISATSLFDPTDVILSGDCQFTLIQDASVKALVYSDPQQDSSRNSAAYYANRVDDVGLVISPGDLSLIDSEAELDDEVKHDSIQTSLAILYPLMVNGLSLIIPGNHDSQGEYPNANLDFALSRLALPHKDHLWFGFDLGYAHFSVVETQAPAYNTVPDACLEWLESDLASTGKPWKIVVSHGPAYYTSGGTVGMVQNRDALADIMEAHGVNLHLSGHKHAYNRYSAKGVLHVIAPSQCAQQPTWSNSGIIDEAVEEDRLPYWGTIARSINDYGYLVLEITRDYIGIRCYKADDNSLLDAFRLLQRPGGVVTRQLRE
jgi:predicted phosphodiesterase